MTLDLTKWGAQVDLQLRLGAGESAGGDKEGGKSVFYLNFFRKTPLLLVGVGKRPRFLVINFAILFFWVYVKGRVMSREGTPTYFLVFVIKEKHHRSIQTCWRQQRRRHRWRVWRNRNTGLLLSLRGLFSNWSSVERYKNGQRCFGKKTVRICLFYFFCYFAYHFFMFKFRGWAERPERNRERERERGLSMALCQVQHAFHSFT